MARIAAWIKAFALSIGAPGLFVIAFLDSSFLSFPELQDLLVIGMVVRNKELMLLYASMATLGSLAGCLALYFVGLKGEEALLKRRFHERHIDRAMGLMRKYGGLALLVPALLPPPAPFKIFVLMAGVAEVPLRTFVIAIAVGRGVRYFGLGIMAVLWGDAALSFLQQNGQRVALGLGVAVLIAGVAYFGWKKRTVRSVRL